MNIPIIIVCFNNYKYVENTINQINRVNKEYAKNIIILNNCSTCIETINYLKNINYRVMNNHENKTPRISHKDNKHIYDILPDEFILTDPDLEFHENLPVTFIEELSMLSNIFNSYKIGFALDIDNEHDMLEGLYIDNCSIYNWELQYYQSILLFPNYHLLIANIDTTFCLINKKYTNNIDLQIRCAGNFKAKHIPWYKKNKIYNVYENYCNYTNSPKSETHFNNKISTTGQLYINYIDANYIKVIKNKELFFIENKENNNIDFWKNDYSNWRNTLFIILDKFLDNNKFFINIGDWNSATSMYISRKSKHMICVESDVNTFNNIISNLETNCNKNYTIINKSIHNIDTDTNVLDSSKSITIEQIFKKYLLLPNEISLIKVDIFGNEENILNDLYNINKQHKIPIYITFNYNSWNDKNIDRFTFLSQEDKNNIISNGSILFYE